MFKKNMCVNYVKICINVWFKKKCFKNINKINLKWYLWKCVINFCCRNKIRW